MSRAGDNAPTCITNDYALSVVSQATEARTTLSSSAQTFMHDVYGKPF